MISDSLSCLGRYLGIHPALDTAIRWLGANDLNALPTGCTEVDGRTVYINVMDAALRPAEGADFEYHHLYAVQKEILRRMYGLELGGVRAPLPGLAPADEAVVAEAERMIREAVAAL